MGGDGHGDGAEDYIYSTVQGASARDYGEDMDDQVEVDFELTMDDFDREAAKQTGEAGAVADREDNPHGDGAADYIEGALEGGATRDYGEDDMDDMVDVDFGGQAGTRNDHLRTRQLRGKQRQRERRWGDAARASATETQSTWQSPGWAKFWESKTARRREEAAEKVASIFSFFESERGVREEAVVTQRPRGTAADDR